MNPTIRERLVRIYRLISRLFKRAEQFYKSRRAESVVLEVRARQLMLLPG